MAYAGVVRESEYGRLRAEYDAAFAGLCAAQPPAGSNEDAVAERFHDALEAYRECRARLAAFLAQTGFDAEVKALAHHLWEEAGRPVGRPEEHWYKAEALIRSRRQHLTEQ